MKKKWRDILGLVLLVAGVGGVLGGIRGVSGGESWGGPALGAGAVANVFAYRVMRSTPVPTRTEAARPDRDDPSA
ncbi:MAG: hypothetical protein KIS78_05510 [Labilithrix sp.]|nr:hypothetical protein [Labilithrix sp.]